MADSLIDLTELDRRRLARLLEELRDDGGPAIVVDDVGRVRRVEILWTNSELDHTAWLLDTPLGRIALVEAASQAWDVRALLRDRIDAYRTALDATRLFLDEVEHGSTGRG